MLSHVFIGVNDFDRAMAFYSPVLERLGLVLRFVPEIAGRYEALKEAHAARGIPVKLSRMLGPLIISTLKDADRIAEAIDARGIRGQ